MKNQQKIQELFLHNFSGFALLREKYYLNTRMNKVFMWLKMVARVKRERTGHPNPLVPDHLKLSQATIDEFVTSMLPCLKSAFSHLTLNSE